MSDQWPWVAAVVVTLGLIGGIVYFDGKQSDTPQASVVPDAVAAVSDSDWVKGNTDAPVTVIEYSDFQCPACRSYQPMVTELLSQRGDKVRFVYRHFPLASHRNADEAARAAEAAGKQGKFWEMHDKLFETQGSWSNEGNVDDIFAGYAGELGLNTDAFNAAYTSDEIDDLVDADRSSGNDAKVNATPTFIVNGTKLPQNPGSVAELLAIVDAEVPSAE